MTLPGVSLTIKDGSLGIVGSVDRSIAKIGTASGGTANTVYSFSDPTVAKTTLISGPLLEEVLRQLQIAGGPVVAVRASATNAGTVGTVTRTGTGVDPGFGTTGAPLDAYEIVCVIVTGGAVGTATFKISFDGGDNFSPVYATAATVAAFAAETGLTLTFAAGTYVAADSYAATAKAPAFSSSDLGNAFDALKASTASFRGVHVVGSTTGADDAAKVTAFVALASAVETKLADFETSGRYIFAILEVPVVADAALNVSGVTSFASVRQAWVAGEAEIASPVSGRSYRRHVGGVFASWVAKNELHELPGKVANGQLPGISALYRDERVTEALEALRINSLRTLVPGGAGFYVTRGSMMAPAGSDFDRLPNRQVMDLACEVVRAELVKSVNLDVDIDTETGFLDEVQARAIERELQGKLDTLVVAQGHTSKGSDENPAAKAQIIRTDNILSTSTLRSKVEVVPKGYASRIVVEVGFTNPFLQVS